MTLQVFSPTETCEPVVLPAREKQIGEQLLSDCVAEIKQSRRAAVDSTSSEDSPLAAALAAMADMRLQLQRKIKLQDYQSGIAILNATPGQQAAVVLEAMTSLVKQRYSDPISDRLCEQVLASLLRRKLPYEDAAIVRMLTLVVADSITPSTLPLLSIVSNVERHVEQHGMSKSVRHYLAKLTKTYYPEAYAADERKIGTRIKALLESPHAQRKVSSGADADAPPGLAVRTPSASQSFDINTGEAWTNALLVELGKLTDDSRNHWHPLLQHCSTAKSSKPTKKWLKQTGELLAPIGDQLFIRVLGPALAAIGQPGECERHNYGGHIQFGEPTQIHEKHVDMLRGLVWATALLDDETVIGIVGDAAEKCFQKIREIGPRCPKVGNACLIALSSSTSASAVAQLGRLKSRAKHVSTRKQIARAFERAADTAGVTEADLAELGVPTFGMTEPGSFSQACGDFVAEITLHPNRKTEWRWVNADGKQHKTVPAAVKSEHADALHRLQKTLKDIDTLMPSVRQRIEQLFLSERRWSLLDFRSRFLDHPVVGVVARRLIWNLEVDHAPTPVFWHEGRFVDASDQTIERFDEQATVSIWHPMQSAAADVLRWRRWLETKQISQPFKQAHREIYILTDAERQTAVYSHRFAAHIVRQHQLAALCQQRGWRFELQGDWDSWNMPFVELPQYKLRVEFVVEPHEGLNELSPSFIYTHLSTDQVRFLHMQPDGPTELHRPLPLENIPPLVFSEVMRDVDLFVAVTSIGNDPAWQQRGAGAWTDYWQQFSFGELSQTAKTRKQTLQAVVPRLTIARQCQLAGSFLVVKGKLRTYKIHLGSGNVLMSPNDQYLCIVQQRGSGTRRTDDIYLPFEGDNTLSLILSKAFLLADDDRIKDPTIANQIRLDRN